MKAMNFSLKLNVKYYIIFSCVIKHSTANRNHIFQETTNSIAKTIKITQVFEQIWNISDWLPTPKQEFGKLPSFLFSFIIDIIIYFPPLPINWRSSPGAMNDAGEYICYCPFQIWCVLSNSFFFLSTSHFYPHASTPRVASFLFSVK